MTDKLRKKANESHALRTYTECAHIIPQSTNTGSNVAGARVCPHAPLPLRLLSLTNILYVLSASMQRRCGAS